MNEWEEEEEYKYLKNLFLAFTSKSEIIKEFIHQTGKEMLRTHLDGNKYSMEASVLSGTRPTVHRSDSGMMAK